MKRGDAFAATICLGFFSLHLTDIIIGIPATFIFIFPEWIGLIAWGTGAAYFIFFVPKPKTTIIGEESK